MDTMDPMDFNPKFRNRSEAFAPRRGLHLAEGLGEIRRFDRQVLHLLCAVGLGLQLACRATGWDEFYLGIGIRWI